MSELLVTIHDLETDQVITREMNAEELAQHEIDLQKAAEREAARKEKNTNKAALLERLGITEDEAKLLLG